MGAILRRKTNNQPGDVFHFLQSKYPRRLIDKNINALLGYYLTLLDMADKGVLTKTKACIMISDTLYNDCVQNHEEVLDIAMDAGFAAFPSNQLNGKSGERYAFISLWINTVAENFRPIR